MIDKHRTLKNNIFISKTLPRISIRMPEAFIYVGQTEIILDDKAAVDRHHLVDADANGAINRLVILHFESLLPSNNSTINYRPPEPPNHAGPNYLFTLEPVRLGDHDYFHNTWFFDGAAAVQEEPQKEWAHTVRLLNRHGYPVPEAMRMSRYVRIIDAARKSELILFYMEPLAPTGFTLDDFVEGGAGAKVYDRLSAEIAARSDKVFMVEYG